MKQSRMEVKENIRCKREISPYTILCCYLLLSLSSCKSSVFLQNIFNKQQYRVAKELTFYDYDCMGTETINDSTTRLESEKIYSYDENNQLISVKKYQFQQDGSSYEYSSYSIIYLNRDSVSILWKTDSRNGSFSLKTKDFFKSDYFRSIGVVNNQTIRCDKGCRLVEHSNKHYEIIYSWNNIFIKSDHYFLDDKGYVVKKMVEDDKSCVTVTVYEYELGYNPYQLYYTFSIVK